VVGGGGVFNILFCTDVMGVMKLGSSLPHPCHGNDGELFISAKMPRLNLSSWAAAALTLLGSG
jgi:hypothetical protein